MTDQCRATVPTPLALDCAPRVYAYVRTIMGLGSFSDYRKMGSLGTRQAWSTRACTRARYRSQSNYLMAASSHNYKGKFPGEFAQLATPRMFTSPESARSTSALHCRQRNSRTSCSLFQTIPADSTAGYLFKSSLTLTSLAS